MLVGLLKQTLSPEEFREFEERALNPEKAAEAARREEMERKMGKFLGEIQTIPAGYRLPAGFAKMWNLLIDDYEEEARNRFIANGRESRHLDSWIKRGWITADAEAKVLKSHIIEPPAKSRPIPALLINESGHWVAPTMLNLIIKEHPFVRAVTKQLPTLTMQEEICEVMKRAATCRKEGDYHATILAESADRLELFLYEQAFGDPAEFGWMRTAKQSQQFWVILDAAIGFGRSLANYETFGDGSVESLIQRSLVWGTGKRATEWRIEIEQKLLEIFQKTGELLTPAKLRKEMGAAAPGGLESILEFENQKYAAMPPIKWKDFRIRAKKSAEKIDLKARSMDL